MSLSCTKRTLPACCSSSILQAKNNRVTMFDELLSSLTVDQSKPRLALLETGERPNRKADIVALLRRHLLSPRLQDDWEKPEPVDRHAVAEAIHNWDGRFDPVRFFNKYLDIPQTFRAGRRGGSGRSKSNASLSLFFYGGIVPEELCASLKAFVPEPEADTLETIADEDVPDALPPEGQKYPENPAASPFRIRRAGASSVISSRQAEANESRRTQRAGFRRAREHPADRGL